MKARYQLRSGKVALLLLWAWISTGLPMSAQTKSGLNWNDVIKAYDRFLDFPSPQNAALLAVLFPKDVPAKMAGDEAAALDHIYSAENFGILAFEAQFGNKDATIVLLRLLNFADGLFAEEISADLGVVLRSKPELFLQVMSENRDASLIKENGPPAAFPSYAYNNHRGAFRYDLEKRIEALRSVTAPELADMKETCIRLLAAEIKTLK